MFKIQIKRLSDNAITHGAQFESMEEANAWIALNEAKSPCPWGIKARVDLVGNPDGSTYEVQVEQTYEIISTDISAQVEQEAINASALAYLASTDWMVTRAIERGEELSAEFKAEREAARASIVR
jgi:hypothetical protein